jgi:hypothetical protein
MLLLRRRCVKLPRQKLGSDMFSAIYFTLFTDVFNESGTISMLRMSRGASRQRSRSILRMGLRSGLESNVDTLMRWRHCLSFPDAAEAYGET